MPEFALNFLGTFFLKKYLQKFLRKKKIEMASKVPYWNQIRTQGKKLLPPEQVKKYSDLVFQNTAFESLRIEENEGNKTHLVSSISLVHLDYMLPRRAEFSVL